MTRVEFLRLARQRDFGTLERRFQELQRAFVQDVEKEADMAIALRAFWTADPDLGPIVDAWVAAKPDSGFAHLARAKYLDQVGWERRGGKSARETPPEALRAMAEVHEAARKEARAALRADSRLIEPYVILIGIAQARGETQGCVGLADEALQLAPASYRIRAAEVDCLLPQWGGSVRAVRLAVREAAPYVEQNPRLAALFGHWDWRRGIANLQRKDYEDAIDLFTRALEAGESWAVLDKRGWARKQLGEHLLALGDYRRALTLQPEEPEVLVDRAYLFTAMGRMDEALDDLFLAREVDPVYNGLPRLREHVLAGAVHFAVEQGKSGDLYRALALLRRTVEEDPRNALAYQARAWVYSELKDDQHAWADLEMAHQLDPEQYPAPR